jgi:hypothetical protein
MDFIKDKIINLQGDLGSATTFDSDKRQASDAANRRVCSVFNAKKRSPS